MKKNILLFIFGIGIIFALLFLLKNATYSPSSAILISNTFIDLLLKNKLKEAYLLTDKNALIGITFNSFENKVNEDFCFNNKKKCKVKFINLYPKQSYGNRLHHFLFGKNVEINLINIEYSVCDIPFTVTLELSINNDWKVKKFQIHAG